MKLSDFCYPLEKKFIAVRPLKRRDGSRLMVCGCSVSHKKFSDLPGYLKKGDVIVVNDSRVKKARLSGKKSTGSPAEVVLLEKLGGMRFRAKVKTRRPKTGTLIVFNGFSCRICGVENDDYFVEFDRLDMKNAHVPLPAYIKDSGVPDERYQTVYSEKEGSFAAPTAGLHFTRGLLKKIRRKGVKIAKVCLHVSFGTFLPVQESVFKSRRIHEECFEVSRRSADIINNRKGRLFVVGTTSLRAIESAFEGGRVAPCRKSTRLFIYPGYKFRNQVDALITNFHLPKSSLLMLVSAFAGRKKILRLYGLAKKKGYRFYSFGDAMMLFRSN